MLHVVTAIARLLACQGIRFHLVPDTAGRRIGGYPIESIGLALVPSHCMRRFDRAGRRLTLGWFRLASSDPPLRGGLVIRWHLGLAVVAYSPVGGMRPRLVGEPGERSSRRESDDHISWPTATRMVRDLACDRAGGYSVMACIDGKEKVYGSIP